MGTTGKRWSKVGAPRHVRLTPEQDAALVARAGQANTTVAALVREAITAYLARPIDEKHEVTP